jgi:hypothetical protein
LSYECKRDLANNFGSYAGLSVGHRETWYASVPRRWNFTDPER